MIINYNDSIYEIIKLTTAEFMKELEMYGEGIDIYRISGVVWERISKQNIYKIIDTKTNDVYYIDNNNTYLNPIQLLAWHDFQDVEKEVPDFYGIHREL